MAREWPVSRPGNVTFLKNDALETVRPDYAGAPFRDGRFLNETQSVAPKHFGDVLKWWMSENPQREEKKSDTFRLPVRSIRSLSEIPDGSIIWLGHASFLIRIGGRWILTDPCWTAPPFQNRYSELPLSWDDLTSMDYVLISHGHYDHLDATTVERMTSRAAMLAPLRMSPVIEGMNRFVSVQEASWYQRYALDEEFSIILLPAQHWHQRMPWDRNRVLWGSFLIQYRDKKIYFAADTGYGAHFKDIHALFGAIDVCLLPIGAYRPTYIMKDNHMDPQEAVQAFHDLHGKTMIPMHYGTFDLADEPLGEPIRWLQRLIEEGGVKGEVRIPDVGEIV